MVVHVEISRVVFTVFEQNEDTVVRLELAEELAALVVVEARDVVVEPHVAAAERRSAVRFERNLVHVKTREQVALAAAALDHNFAEVLIEG